MNPTPCWFWFPTFKKEASLAKKIAKKLVK